MPNWSGSAWFINSAVRPSPSSASGGRKRNAVRYLPGTKGSAVPFLLLKLTACVDGNWLERWRSFIIRVLVTVMVIAFAPLSAATVVRVSPAPLLVSVDPRVELFSVIYHLAANPEQSTGSVAPYYETVVDEYFRLRVNFRIVWRHYA